MGTSELWFTFRQDLSKASWKYARNSLKIVYEGIWEFLTRGTSHLKCVGYLMLSQLLSVLVIWCCIWAKSLQFWNLLQQLTCRPKVFKCLRLLLLFISNLFNIDAVNVFTIVLYKCCWCLFDFIKTKCLRWFAVWYYLECDDVYPCDVHVCLCEDQK